MVHSANTESEQHPHPRGLMMVLPISQLGVDSAIPLTWGSRLAGSCSPANPRRTSSQSVQNEDALGSTGQDEPDCSLFIVVSSLSPGRCIKAFHTCKATSIPSIWDPCLIPRVFNWEPKVPSGACSPLGNSAST